MPNLHAVNAGAVNAGAKYVAIFASATILATATCEPTANRVQFATAAADAVAVVSASAQQIHAAKGSPLAVANVTSPAPNVRYAGVSTMEATATLVGNPLRYVYADVQFEGIAEVFAFPGASL